MLFSDFDETLLDDSKISLMSEGTSVFVFFIAASLVLVYCYYEFNFDFIALLVGTCGVNGSLIV